MNLELKFFNVRNEFSGKNSDVLFQGVHFIVSLQYYQLNILIYLHFSKDYLQELRSIDLILRDCMIFSSENWVFLQYYTPR